MTYSYTELKTKSKTELINIIIALQTTNALWQHATKELLKPAPTPYVGYEREKKSGR